MRWESLFEDLEAQADGMAGAERNAEVADRVTREVGRQRLADRLRVATGESIVLRIVAGGPVRGTPAAAGNGWVVVDEESGGQVLVPLRQVLAISGLGQRAATPGSEGEVGARLGLGYVLREWARDRMSVTVLLTDGGAFNGVIVRVGADFCDLADEPGTAASRGATAVPFDAIALVRRAGREAVR